MIPEPILEAVAKAVDGFIEGGGTPGVAVSLVREGRPAWSGAWGLADPFTGRPATADTLFRIASVTKPFTATAVLQLRDEGRLALHDPLVRHLPEATLIDDPFGVLEHVTVGQVLLHTAGLQADAPPVDPRSGPALRHPRLRDTLRHARLVRPPDTHWHYSNLGYELLAMLVSRLAGRPYAEHLATAVTGPAGLADTTYHPRAGQHERIAVGVLPRSRANAWTRAPDHDSEAYLGDGGLWSTVDDLARWIAVHCLTSDADRRGDGHRILDGPTLRELQRPMVIVDLDGWRSAQGLGWASFRVDDDIWQGHTGSMAGFRSIALLRAADGLGVVALTNGADRPNPVAFAACRALLADRRSRVPAAPPECRADAVPDGPGPQGPWQDPAFGRILSVVGDAGGALVLAEAGLPPVPLVPGDDDRSWRIGGDEGRRGELVWHVHADAEGPETLLVAGWPFHRVPG